MKNIDFTPIIEALIALLSTIITLVVLPKVRKYLNEKLSAEQRENLKQWVKVAVAAAEQLHGSKTGQQKKEYVLSFLLSKGIVFDVDEVYTLIESEVYKLSRDSIHIKTEPSGNDETVAVTEHADTPEDDATEPVPDDERENNTDDEGNNLCLARNTCE